MRKSGIEDKRDIDFSGSITAHHPAPALIISMCSDKEDNQLESEKLGSDAKVTKSGFKGGDWSTDPLGRGVVNPPIFHARYVDSAVLSPAP